MNDLDLSKPILLYGSNISYFTGKMENYFRVKEISYEQKVLDYPRFERTMKKKSVSIKCRLLNYPMVDG